MVATLRDAGHVVRRFARLVQTLVENSNPGVSGMISELHAAAEALSKQLVGDHGSLGEALDITPDAPLTPRGEELLQALLAVVEKHRGSLDLATLEDALHSMRGFSSLMTRMATHPEPSLRDLLPGFRQAVSDLWVQLGTDFPGLAEEAARLDLDQPLTPKAEELMRELQAKRAEIESVLGEGEAWFGGAQALVVGDVSEFAALLAIVQELERQGVIAEIHAYFVE